MLDLTMKKEQGTLCVCNLCACWSPKNGFEMFRNIHTQKNAFMFTQMSGGGGYSRNKVNNNNNDKY